MGVDIRSGMSFTTRRQGRRCLACCDFYLSCFTFSIYKLKRAPRRGSRRCQACFDFVGTFFPSLYALLVLTAVVCARRCKAWIRRRIVCGIECWPRSWRTCRVCMVFVGAVPVMPVVCVQNAPSLVHTQLEIAVIIVVRLLLLSHQPAEPADRGCGRSWCRGSTGCYLLALQRFITLQRFIV